MCYTKGCWNKKKKLEKLVDLGTNKIEEELNVVKIMNDLRNLKIMLKHSIMTKELKKKIKLTGKNIIDLDTSSDDSSKHDSEQNDEENLDPANNIAQVVEDNIDLGIVSRSKSAERAKDKEQRWKKKLVRTNTYAPQQPGSSLIEPVSLIDDSVTAVI